MQINPAILKRKQDFDDKDKQDLFIKAIPVARRGPGDEPVFSHASLYRFHILVREQKLEICKKAFMIILAVGEKKVTKTNFIR